MDDVDVAQESEFFFREVALHKALTLPVEEPLEIDGVRCCLGCKMRIPTRRLRVKPDAVRCVQCQEREERGFRDVRCDLGD